jgi:pimeloyl-ACP methyl ester carboxylesterase
VEIMKEVFPELDIVNDAAFIEDAGHWVHSERPNEFIEEVAKFIV